MLSTFICMNSKTMSWFGKVEKAKDVSPNKLANLPLFVLIFFFCWLYFLLSFQFCSTQDERSAASCYVIKHEGISSQDAAIFV